MATYPDLGFEEGSIEDWADPLLLSTSRGGGTKGRRLQAGKKRLFRVLHVLTAAERATLEAFYDANRAVSFDFAWNGVTYSVIFADKQGLSWRPKDEPRRH